MKTAEYKIAGLTIVAAYLAQSIMSSLSVPDAFQVAGLLCAFGAAISVKPAWFGALFSEE